ncbi:MAG TPA: FtsX-like permease family protein [Blastocatellia bacterium]|nr:FtsX-like permease family protein [Blastocatellia bacterium]
MDSLIAANLRQRPLRTAISVSGVALGVILVVLFVGLSRGMMRDTIERQSNVEAEIRFLPAGKVSLQSNPLGLPAGYVDAIMRGVQPSADDPDLIPKPPVAGVTAVSPVGSWMQSSVGGIGFEIVDGIDYASFTRTTKLKIIAGRGLGDGLTPESEYEAIVDRFYSEHNKGKDGAPIRVGSRIEALGHEFTVAGIFEPPMLGRVKIPLRTMQDLLGGANNCSFLLVKLENPELTDGVIETLKQYYPGNHVVAAADIPALYSQGFQAVEIFLKVVMGLALVISTLVILLAMYTTITERTREIGILKSLGASKQFIVMTIEKEAALISLLGVAFGFLVAVAGKYGIEANTRLLIELKPGWLLIAAVIGVVGGVVGALYPAVRAANLDPVEAISYD